jgi:hypothetical protein
MMCFARISRAAQQRLPQGLKPRVSFSSSTARLKSCSFKTLVLAAGVLFALSAAAQTTPAAPQEPVSKGKVIFSRSTDENGETQTVQPAQQSTGEGKLAAPQVPPTQVAEQRAVTFTDFDMDVRLHSEARQIAVRALLTVRNDGKTPLAEIPLQLSSSLNWERIRLNARDVDFQVATLNSDADHTGQLHEAVVPLPQSLAPGQTLQLDVSYSGQIAASALRHRNPQRRGSALGLGSDRRGFHRPARLWQRALVSGGQRARHSGRWRAPL